MRMILAWGYVADTLKLLPAAFECFPGFFDMFRIDSIATPGIGSSECAVDQATSELG